MKACSVIGLSTAESAPSGLALNTKLTIKKVEDKCFELIIFFSSECLANFLIGEGRLESFLEDNPPVEANTNKLKNGLQDAKRYLKLVIGEDGRKAGIALDAFLLLAKLDYACGNYDESLDNFIKAELNTLSEKELTLRSLRILAESYAIKGLCLEQQGIKAPSKFKKAEKEAEMV